MPELLIGDSGGQSASQISGEWLSCPGSYWEWWFVLRLHNTSDGPIVIESIDYSVILGGDNTGFVYTGEMFLWADPAEPVTPNLPEQGCAHASSGSAGLEDSWEVDIAELLSGLLVYGNSLPDDLIRDSIPPYTLLHEFTGTPQTWNPLGGLEIAAGASISIASPSQIHVEISASIQHEIEIEAVLPALIGAITLEYSAPSRDLEIAAVLPALTGSVDFLWGYQGPEVEVEYEACGAGVDPDYESCAAGEAIDYEEN